MEVRSHDSGRMPTAFLHQLSQLHGLGSGIARFFEHDYVCCRHASTDQIALLGLASIAAPGKGDARNNDLAAHSPMVQLGGLTLAPTKRIATQGNNHVG